MNFADIKTSFTTKKGRFFRIFLILVTGILLNIFVELNNRFLHLPIFSYNSNWYFVLVNLSLILSLSIFLVSYYTYPQIKNIRLLITGYTFLTVGLVDWLNLMIFSGVVPFDHTSGNANSILIMWIVARLINAIGFSFLISVNAQYQKEVKRSYLFLISLGVVAISYSLAAFLPGKPDVFLEGVGLTAIGLFLAVIVALLCIYCLYRSLREYKINLDIVPMVLSYVFMLMFFSSVSILKIRLAFDGWSVLSHLFQLMSLVLTIKVFYVHGIQRPYRLLSKAKEELNGYLQELDELVDKRTIELRNMNEKLLADQEIARDMQLSMLPTNLPADESVAFSAGYLPADNLSGDFYNVFRIDDIRYGVCIGDVSGHGVSAAMLSIFTFQKMQSLMEEAGGEGMAIPSLVLKHLYDSFNAANFNEDMYIVMLYGVINTQTGIFSYASGGLNTTPLRIRPDGSIQELDNDGYAICKLGDLLKPKFVNHQILLFPGDKLVLYTDGLIDARNDAQEEYSIERLKKAILRHHKWGAEHLSKAIVRDVKSFTGEDPADDITLLAIDVLRPF